MIQHSQPAVLQFDMPNMPSHGWRMTGGVEPGVFPIPLQRLRGAEQKESKIQQLGKA